jgi:hypothetical protein
MDRDDPEELADHLEREADKLQQHSDEVGEEIEHVRQDWERKHADESVPGALPPERAPEDAHESRGHSPAPQAPPETEEPSAASMPPEGAVGPPKDVIDED